LKLGDPAFPTQITRSEIATIFQVLRAHALTNQKHKKTRRAYTRAQQSFPPMIGVVETK